LDDLEDLEESERTDEAGEEAIEGDGSGDLDEVVFL
jgi:hypothetical protein